jgi:hypothetical protein
MVGHRKYLLTLILETRGEALSQTKIRHLEA